MFPWYKKSAICYVYLSDVQSSDDPRLDSSSFMISRWFERGWTLQELLAPTDVRFYNAEWEQLGTKRALAAMITRITNIPVRFLRNEPLSRASVAQRMSWAASRATKRVEDRAYSLLGIFDVNIPMLYGEGQKSFQRLQEEIIKQTRDDSVLAWGFGLSVPAEASHLFMLASALAPSPSAFLRCGNILSQSNPQTSSKWLHVAGDTAQIQIHLHNDSNSRVFGLLRSRVEGCLDQAIAIPLSKISSSMNIGEYVRPQDRSPILVQNAGRNDQVQTIRVHLSSTALNDEQSGWLYVEEDEEAKVDLMEVKPDCRWLKESGIISDESIDRNSTSYTLARFRHITPSCRDFVVAINHTSSQPSAAIMILSRRTPLDAIMKSVRELRPVSVQSCSADNGVVGLNVVVEQSTT